MLEFCLAIMHCIHSFIYTFRAPARPPIHSIFDSIRFEGMIWHLTVIMEFIWKIHCPLFNTHTYNEVHTRQMKRFGSGKCVNR